MPATDDPAPARAAVTLPGTGGGCCGRASGPRALSGLSLAFLAIIGVAPLALVIVDWPNILVLPLAALPPALITGVVYVGWLRRRVPQDDAFVRILFAAFLPGAALCLLLEAALTLLFALLCMGEALSPLLRSVATDPQGSGLVRNASGLSQGAGFWIFIVLTAFVTAAATEESIKAAVVRLACLPAFDAAHDLTLCVQRRRAYASARARAYATLGLFLAAAIGFASAENLLYIFAESLTRPPFSARFASVGAKAAIAAVRGIITMPVHCVCAAFTALRLTVRDGQLDRLDELEAAAAKGGLFEFVEAGVEAAGAEHAAAAAAAGEEGAPAVDGAAGASPQSRRRKADAPPAAAGAHVVRLLAEPPPTAAGEDAAGSWQLVLSAEDARAQADALTVWSWPRVIWPAILIHGLFDAQGLLLAAALSAALGDALVTSLTLLLGAFMLAFAGWVLYRQYDVVFAALARDGEAPDAVSQGLGSCAGACRCCGCGTPARTCCGGARGGGGASPRRRRRSSAGDDDDVDDDDEDAAAGSGLLAAAAAGGGADDRPGEAGGASSSRYLGAEKNIVVSASVIKVTM